MTKRKPAPKRKHRAAKIIVEVKDELPVEIPLPAVIDDSDLAVSLAVEVPDVPPIEAPLDRGTLAKVAAVINRILGKS